MSELDFNLHNTLYATHGLHAYAAKCPPQLVGYALERYSKPGETLLDPMVGSGTALVEARLMGRNAIGYDIDPIARLVARAKSRDVSARQVDAACAAVLGRARADAATLTRVRRPAAVVKRASPPSFPNRDYWFEPKVAAELALLASHIAEVATSRAVRDFLWVAYSSLILARTSVANARDIIHSRHHYMQHKVTPDVLGRYERRITQMLRQTADFRARCALAPQATYAEARLGDARRLRLGAESIDLVFTSPPYATALDYPRAHFLAIPWMQAALTTSFDDYQARASTYIGSERGKLTGPVEVSAKLMGFPLTTRVVTELANVSARQAKLTHRYFEDMLAVLEQIHRVLRPRRHAVIVVCPSHIRRVNVPTHEVFVEISNAVGLQLIEQHVRTISERRRVMPYMGSFGNRMNTEYVLVLRKS
jgi:SAM-dependent methyltransferase